MSAPNYPPPPPPPSGIRPRRRSVAAMVIGWILIVIGFLTALSGVILLVLFGSNAAVTSGLRTLSSPTPVLVSDLGTIQNVGTTRMWTGVPNLVVSSTNSGAKPTFIGIGPTADVERYLSGVATDRITEFELSPFNLSVVRQDGAQDVGSPGEQPFWVAKLDSATATEFSWPISDGRYEIVVMNADGSAGVTADVSVGVSIPDSTRLWILVIVVGAVMLIGGIVLVVIGARRVPEPPPYYPAAPTGYPAGPTGYPAGPTGYPAGPTGYPAGPTGYPAGPTNTADRPAGPPDRPAGPPDRPAQPPDRPAEPTAT